MSIWSEQQTSESSINDARLKRRLSIILDELGRSPSETIPASCQKWSSTKATYRFFDNPKINDEAILEGHKVQVSRKVKREKIALFVQDTTHLTLERYCDNRDSFGTITRYERQKYMLHTTVAFSYQRQNLGVIHEKLWERVSEDKRQNLKSKPDKESNR